MSESDRLTPSLLEPQSRGGDIAEGGFSFQEQITLARIPVWLAQESFTSMLREGIGDVEAKFFVPGCGFTKELLEVKDHVLQPSKFWNEIRRFQEIEAGSPNTYRKFILVATGISKELEPLINGLRRVLHPRDFYEENSTIKKNSFQDYVQIVERLKRTEKDASFIFDKVIIDVDWNTAKIYGEAIFKQYLVDNLPDFEDLSNKILDNIYNHLGTFIKQYKNKNITRQELETKLRDKIPSNQLPSFRPIQIYTAISPEDNPNHSGVRFDWTAFSGGETRAIAPPDKWNQLMVELQDTRKWVENYRNTKRIRLAGNRRISACLAIGSVFSAVRGYVIEMEYRDDVWATDAYRTEETPTYPLSYNFVEKKGNDLVVCISICRDIRPEVEANLEKHGLAGMPLLYISGKIPIISSQQANLVAGKIKKFIVDNLVSLNGKAIHLFFAGPAHLALFLGHRLDATAPITCYMWISTNNYSRTCKLFSGNTN